MSRRTSKPGSEQGDGKSPASQTADSSIKDSSRLISTVDRLILFLILCPHDWELNAPGQVFLYRWWKRNCVLMSYPFGGRWCAPEISVHDGWWHGISALDVEWRSEGLRNIKCTDWTATTLRQGKPRIASFWSRGNDNLSLFWSYRSINSHTLYLTNARGK